MTYEMAPSGIGRKNVMARNTSTAAAIVFFMCTHVSQGENFELFLAAIMAHTKWFANAEEESLCCHSPLASSRLINLP